MKNKNHKTLIPGIMTRRKLQESLSLPVVSPDMEVQINVSGINFIYKPGVCWVPETPLDMKRFQDLSNEQVFRIGYFLIKNFPELITNQQNN